MYVEAFKPFAYRWELAFVLISQDDSDDDDSLPDQFSLLSFQQLLVYVRIAIGFPWSSHVLSFNWRQVVLLLSYRVQLKHFLFPWISRQKYAIYES